MNPVAMMLREARDRSGRSQAQVADELGKTQPLLTKWEGGKCLPPVGETAEIAAAYGVNRKRLLDAIVAAHEARARKKAKAA